MNSFLQNRPVLGRKDGAPAAPESVQDFTPMLKPGISSVSVADGLVPADSAGAAAHEPKVELVENGGRLERIIVTCPCCNRIELQCQY